VIDDLKPYLPETLFDNTGEPLWIPIDDISEGTFDLNRPLEEQSAFSFRPWTSEEREAFDKEYAACDATILKIRERVDNADRAGKPLDEKDMKWLNANQIAGPTGYRSKYYRDSPQVIRDAINDYESWLNPSNWRDVIRLIIEALRFDRGTPHMNRVMFEIEIGRVTEYRNLLGARRNRPVRKHYRSVDRHGE